MGVGRVVGGRIVLSSIALALALFAAPKTSHANGMICINGPGDEIEVCVSWSQSNKPDPDSDFHVEFADAYSPIVTLKTGNLGWNIIVREIATGAPANLSAVFIDPPSKSSNYGLSFKNGFDPAVNNVGHIVLISSANWLGHSSLAGGNISGNLEGSLQLQRNALGQGGVITNNLFIQGDIHGDVYVPSITNAWVIVGGDLIGSFAVTDEILDSTLDIEGDIGVGSYIDVTDLQGYTVLVLGSASNYPFGEYSGTLNLRSGLPAGAEVYMWGALTSTGVIDFNNNDIEGSFEMEAGGSGQIVNGGVVRSSGHLWVSSGSENTFSGTATFAGIEPFGAVEAEYSNIDGTINILGDMDGSLWVRVGPLLSNGKFYIKGNVGDSGSINIASVTGFGGDVLGSIEVNGEMRGNITVDGTVYGDISAASLIGGGQYPWSGLVDLRGNLAGIVEFEKIEQFGTLMIAEDVSGDIAVGKIESGTILIWEDLSGTVDVYDSIVSGSVFVTQNVTSTAHVSIADMSSDGATVSLGSGDIGQYQMDGHVELYAGVPFNCLLAVPSESGPNAVIDLHNGGVSGFITMDGGGYGQLINGGVLHTNGHVWVATGDGVWRGHATFSSSEQYGTIDAEAGDVDGIVEFTGRHDGQIVIRGGDLLANGLLRFGGSIGATGGVYVWGFDGITGNCLGDIQVVGKMAGMIDVTRTFDSTAQISIGAALIGQIKLRQNTVSGSLIELAGIGSGASVVINDDAGPFNADGDIIVGSPISQRGVTFDGCIRVRQDSVGGSGDLNGNITVSGCHATPAPLNICVDGTINGSIVINQFNCLNQVTWSCGGCP